MVGGQVTYRSTPHPNSTSFYCGRNMTLLMTIAACVLVLLLCYKYIVFPSLVSPLSKIPNAHFTSPFSPIWMWHRRRSGTQNRTIFALHQRLGPVVRIGPSEISVNSAESLRTIYVGGFEKHNWYRDNFRNYGTPNLVSTLEHKPHSVQKRMISHVYSKSYLQNSPDLRTLSCTLLLERVLPVVESAVRNGTSLNVLDLTQAVGMDFTSAYLFGSAQGTNFLCDVEYRHRWLKLYSVFKTQRPEERAGGEIEQWCLSLCEAAEAYSNSEKNSPDSPSSTQPVVYGRLSQCMDDIKPGPQPKTLFVASEMLDHLLAGSETSGITLTYLMYEMSRRPSLQSALREELLTLSPRLVYPLASPSPTSETKHRPLASVQAIDALPLLNSILQETLRLYAAAPAPQPRMTPSSPITIEGYTNVPGGTRIGSSAYTLHRNPAVFPSPHDWIPERWLHASKDKADEMRRWFWAFGSGGRMCLGSNFAIQEMKLIVAAIYTNYETETVDDEGIEPIDSFIAGPRGNKLILKFKLVKDQSK